MNYHTKLEKFARRHGLRTVDLARVSGLAPRTIDLIRRGSNTTLDSARALACACRELSGRRVRLADLFDLSVPESSCRER